MFTKNFYTSFVIIFLVCWDSADKKRKTFIMHTFPLLLTPIKHVNLHRKCNPYINAGTSDISIQGIHTSCMLVSHFCNYPVCRKQQKSGLNWPR